MKKILEVDNLSYKVNNKLIIKNINCVIEKGITIIKGPNGAGKTTFLKLLFGLLNPTDGAVIKNYNESETKKSFVFQNPIFLDRTVKENLKHTLYCKNISSKHWDKIITEKAMLYNIGHMLNLNIKMLSGGELQLLSLIRSVIIEPNILFYDEPSNNLDINNIDLLIQLINKLYYKGGSIVMVSHNDFPQQLIKYNKLSINQGTLQC